MVGRNWCNYEKNPIINLFTLKMRRKKNTNNNIEINNNIKIKLYQRKFFDKISSSNINNNN